MTRRSAIGTLLVWVGWCATAISVSAAELRLEAEQITSGPKHHFFGYIGHAGTCPWDRSGRYIVALQADFQDHMPRPQEAADVILIDTRERNAIRVVDRTRAWNFQQGTMLYWNPEAPETQFFFNDRDPDTGRVFCVLFDIAQGPGGRRIKEYHYPDTPIGNSGVAQRGGSFLGLNYGRLSRLRPVTGYPDAFDWTAGVKHPEDDGLFHVNARTGAKRLIVSYRQLAAALGPSHPGVDDQALFLNHTLWNRDDDRIFFYARADFEGPEREKRLDVLFVVNPDGSGLTRLRHHLGGHLDWERGHRMIGTRGDRLALYDTDHQEFVANLGGPDLLGDPDGDKALAADGNWFVNGFRTRGINTYVLFRRSSATALRSRGFDPRGWTTGPLRVDPAPCWNREGTKVLVPSIAGDAARTRQLFLIRVVSTGTP
jgi:hypothetical protein